jgi:uncharacterized membrane protein YedE/YeeE
MTPVSALLGGVLIGTGASLLWAVNGRVAGISGIVGGLLPQRGSPRLEEGERSQEVSWRVLFILGLLSGGLLVELAHPSSFGEAPVPPFVVMAAGLLVGFGTRLGGGCTSGHGVCGLSRLSVRSLFATLTFMAAGVLSAVVVQHLIRGGP